MPPASRILVIVAAPAEARAVLTGLSLQGSITPWTPRTDGPFDLALSGIGKANAAGATGRFADPTTHAAILSIGVAGALPDGDLAIPDTVVASSVIHADEGVQAPDRFMDCSEIGLSLGQFSGSAMCASDSFTRWLLRALKPVSPKSGGIATVSTCSGTDALARTIRDRTGAVAECMEGAAVGLIAHRLGIPFGEVRIISNTTGDRGRQVWDLKRALEVLSRVIGLLAQSEPFRDSRGPCAPCET